MNICTHKMYTQELIRSFDVDSFYDDFILKTKQLQERTHIVSC